MRRFQNVPISKKLIITFGVIAIVALLISITFLSITSWLYERNRALIELHTTAELIGANSNAALVFNDVKAAKETLSTLQTLGDIVFAALYDSDGKEFARYLRDGHENIVTNLLSTVRAEDKIESGYITVVEPVVLDGSPIGSVVLKATLQNRSKQLEHNIAIAAVILVIAFAIAMLLAILLGRTITNPLIKLSKVMKQVSNDHDYSIRTHISQDDEIGVLANGLDNMLARAQERDLALENHRKKLEAEVDRRTAALQNANEQLTAELTTRKEAEQRLKRAHDALELHHKEFFLLSEMNDRLQVCRTVDETSPVVENYARKLFRGSAGGLYIFDSSRSIVAPIVRWGTSKPENDSFRQDDCWALRQGRLHVVNDPNNDLICPHCAEDINSPYLCIPMIAYGDVMGVLHLRLPAIQQQEQGQTTAEDVRQLASTTSEHLALALANLKLKEVLQMQSVRDPLTGLFNRRYMQESFEREIARSARAKSMIGVIMIDIDYFKTFNDTYGHKAGDIVLHELGAFLKNTIREEDIACRYGGEELIIIMPGITKDSLEERADAIRRGVKNLQIQHRGQRLKGLSISLGLALYPLHGKTMDSLISAADDALYDAKRQGRDQTCMANSTEYKNNETNSVM